MSHIFEHLDAVQQLFLVITINFVKYQIAIIYLKLWHNTSLGADGGDCGDVEWWWEEQEEGRGEEQWQLRRRIWSQYCHCYHHCRHQNAEYNNMLDWLGPGPGAHAHTQYGSSHCEHMCNNFCFKLRYISILLWRYSFYDEGGVKRGSEKILHLWANVVWQWALATVYVRVQFQRKFVWAQDGLSLFVVALDSTWY